MEKSTFIMITKGDKILTGIVLTINLLSIPFVFALQKAGIDVIVETENKLTGNYSLKKDQLLSVKGPLGVTKIEIKDGRARITESPCLHKVCVKMGWIRNAGKIAVCVPNQVVVRITGEKVGGPDAITG